MFLVVRAFDAELVSFERFVEIIDEEIKKGFHLTALPEEIYGPYAFMVCYW